MAHKMRVLIFILLLLSIFTAKSYSQSSGKACSGEMDTLLHKFVYKTADKMPAPVGGLDNMYRIINKQIKYPGTYVDEKVILTVVIDVNGNIIATKVLRDTSDLTFRFGEQILPILDKIKWTPGACNKQPVPVIVEIPVNISIRI